MRHVRANCATMTGAFVFIYINIWRRQTRQKLTYEGRLGRWHEPTMVHRNRFISIGFANATTARKLPFCELNVLCMARLRSRRYTMLIKFRRIQLRDLHWNDNIVIPILNWYWKHCAYCEIWIFHTGKWFKRPTFKHKGSTFYVRKILLWWLLVMPE